MIRERCARAQSKGLVGCFTPVGEGGPCAARRRPFIGRMGGARPGGLFIKCCAEQRGPIHYRQMIAGPPPPTPVGRGRNKFVTLALSAYAPRADTRCTPFSRRRRRHYASTATQHGNRVLNTLFLGRSVFVSALESHRYGVKGFLTFSRDVSMKKTVLI